MLHSQQADGAGLSTAGVVGIGRLLMHSADVCADLEQTEQLVGLLVRSYVQPQPSGIQEGLGRGKGGDRHSSLVGLLTLKKTNSRVDLCTDNKRHMLSGA